MKKFMFAAIMMIASLGASAQTPEVGTLMVRPMAGITISSLGVDVSSGDWSVKSKYKVGFTAGGEFGYQALSWLQPSIGVFYSQQGSKIEEKSEGHSASENLNADYLIIPVLANFYVADGLALKAGLQPGILLSAKEGSDDVKDAFESFQLQIPIGVSYQYQNFTLDARAFIPVTKAAKKSADENPFKDDGMNNTFAITVGYNFSL